MAQDNNVLNKSFEFSIRIVKLYQHLSKEQKEYVLSKQLLRSGTSIGANINEAQAGQSKADFASKMSIASKEARETKYWLELLCATGYIDKLEPHVMSLLEQSDELIKILTTIVKNTQQNLKANSKA
ncbi:four helix bundle protein [Oceanisphaera profunda]|uniref:Four helix bundle protein n=2 Tax=Oceanisphaera profunda TaxID=1416627 RepID=A0A1Y0D2M2_9GAMM|nr:four helix bundle protein [Oceanisphaera profunda]